MDEETLLKKLRWRCRRGMRELDQLFERYLDREWGSAPTGEREVFLFLLDCEDELLAVADAVDIAYLEGVGSGTITSVGGTPRPHIHVAAGVKSQGSTAYAGHLLRGEVHYTVEVTVTARGTSRVATPPEASVPLMVRLPAAAADWVAQTAPVTMAAGVIVYRCATATLRPRIPYWVP